MKLLALRITNFRSFKATQELKFPDKAGIYFICGENKAEPRLEANGAGKSTIWDALCWLLYGKTSRGLKSGDVNNWDVGSKTRIELDYEFDGEVFTCTRTWGPITWVLEGADGIVHTLTPDAKENLLYAHLRLSYSPFMHACFMAQASPMFLDLKPPEKALIFSDVMNLDKWIDYSTKASSMASECDKEVRTIDRELSNKQGQLESIKATDYSEETKRWEEDRDLQVEEKEKEHKTKLNSLAGLKVLKEKHTSSAEVIEDSLSVLHTRITDARKKLDECWKDQDAFVARISKAQGTLEVLESQQHYLEEHDKCTKCFQPITGALRNQRSGETTKERKALEKAIHDDTVGSAELSDLIAACEKFLSQLVENVDNLKDKVRAERSKATDADRSMKQTNSDLDRLENDVVRLLECTNPHLQKQNEIDIKTVVLKEYVVLLEKELTNKLTYMRSLQYWVKGFKDLRLYLISEALQQLEIEVNSSLAQLGLVDWQLRFSIDRETKSGSMQRGLTVTVVSPHNKDPVPWESWSGGEAQRLRIAATMGLSNLILSSTGSPVGIEIWDEPTTHISSQGINDLLEALSERAIAKNKQIFIVDHRSLSYGGFQGKYTVVKDSSGSKII